MDGVRLPNRFGASSLETNPRPAGAHLLRRPEISVYLRRRSPREPAPGVVPHRHNGRVPDPLQRCKVFGVGGWQSCQLTSARRRQRCHRMASPAGQNGALDFGGLDAKACGLFAVPLAGGGLRPGLVAVDWLVNAHSSTFQDQSRVGHVQRKAAVAIFDQVPH